MSFYFLNFADNSYEIAMCRTAQLRSTQRNKKENNRNELNTNEDT